MRMHVALMVLLMTTGVALADSYTCPQRDGIDTCPVDTVVPEGCPAHILLGHAPVPANLHATVIRGGQTVDVTGPISTTEVTHSVGTKDYYSCDCAEISVSRMFDLYAVTLTGAVAGDTITIEGPTPAHVDIGPPGPCPGFTYATNFYEPIACDRCPDGPEDSAAGDDTGCAVGGTGSLLVGLALSLRLVHRRRLDR